MATKMRRPSRDFWVALAGFAAVLVAGGAFFQFGYQQHLLHREQNTLFLTSLQYVEETYRGMGWLARVVGDYLTQYFYYLGAGAAILAVSLALIWVLAYLIMRQSTALTKASWSHWLAAAVATVLAVWEGLRETGSSYEFSSTVSILALLAIVNVVAWVWRKRVDAGIVSAMLLLPAGVWLFAYQDDDWINLPDFELEKIMAIDNAAYFGQWGKVKGLSAEMPDYRLAVFYNSLANARQGQLTEAIRDKIALGPEILLPVVGPNSSYMRIGATGMAWHMMGDYTMAEHCYILSMIFSPRSTGTRHLREMARVNLDNGDLEAANKYLRMLAETSVHSCWAKQRLSPYALRLTPNALRPTQDALRSANDMVTSLRHLCHTQPDNNLAYEYLMNYHLVTGNTMGVLADYDSNRPNHQWYQQALLVAMSQSDTDMRQAFEMGVPQSMLSNFGNYIERYLGCHGNLEALKREFGDTYWYQYHLLNPQR